jgi:predicted  nucleic acid-binding Zn-ribbon protein
MNANPAALLALISNLTEQLFAVQAERDEARDEVARLLAEREKAKE